MLHNWWSVNVCTRNVCTRNACGHIRQTPLGGHKENGKCRRGIHTAHRIAFPRYGGGWGTSQRGSAPSRPASVSWSHAGHSRVLVRARRLPLGIISAIMSDNLSSIWAR